MNNIQLIVAYDGKEYFGFQKAAGKPTIQEALEKAIAIPLQHPVKVQGASRTDRGVHAQGQVVQFFTKRALDEGKFQASLNRLLPSDIRVVSVEKVAPSFHPSLDAVEKTYRYQVSTKPILLPHERLYYWHFPKKMVQDMQAAIPLFLGEKNYQAFSTEIAENPLCNVTAIAIEEKKGLYTLKITANRFLYKMARTIAGTLLYFGAGRIDLKEIAHLFIKTDRKSAGMSAPALGLTLETITYTKKT